MKIFHTFIQDEYLANSIEMKEKFNLWNFNTLRMYVYNSELLFLQIYQGKIVCRSPDARHVTTLNRIYV